jgi:hypothetical protein
VLELGKSIADLNLLGLSHRVAFICRGVHDKIMIIINSFNKSSASVVVGRPLVHAVAESEFAAVVLFVDSARAT